MARGRIGSGHDGSRCERGVDVCRGSDRRGWSLQSPEVKGGLGGVDCGHGPAVSMEGEWKVGGDGVGEGYGDKVGAERVGEWSWWESE